jgi:hypothetical protein
MQRVKGIYDGISVRLIEAVDLPPDTEVEVLIPDRGTDREEEYWRQLKEAGLVLQRPQRPATERRFRPVPISGEPLSQTVIDNRR